MLEKNLNPDATDSLKAAFRRHASGVAVITALNLDGTPMGFTATSMTSLGSNPALLTFNVARGSSSWPGLSSSTHIAVHMLGERNLELSKKMAADHTKRFIDTDWEFQEFGLPVFLEATAVLFGKIREIHNIEMNAIFVVDVVSGKLGDEDRALLYNQRGYFTPSDSAL